MNMGLELRDSFPGVADFIQADELDLLASSAGVMTLFQRISLLEREPYPFKVIAEAVSSYFRDARGEIGSDLADERRFAQILRRFLDFHNNRELRVDRERFLQAFKPTGAAIDDYFRPHIGSIPGGEVWKLFDFGVGEGLFEKQLIASAKQRLPDLKAEIQGYDPFVAVLDDSVRYLASSADFSGDAHWFLCRWALHHVPLRERWSTLGGFLAKLKPGSRVFLIEEGVFCKFADQNFSERVYTLLLSLADVVFNSVARSAWGSSTDFFVRHLDGGDLIEIESFIPVPFQREIHRFQRSSFHQTIVSYGL